LFGFPITVKGDTFMHREVAWPLKMCNGSFDPQSQLPTLFLSTTLPFYCPPSNEEVQPDTDTIYLFIRKANEYVPDGLRGLQHVSCSHSDSMGLV
jgi:hypothetical protein